MLFGRDCVSVGVLGSRCCLLSLQLLVLCRQIIRTVNAVFKLIFTCLGRVLRILSLEPLVVHFDDIGG